MRQESQCPAQPIGVMMLLSVAWVDAYRREATMQMVANTPRLVWCEPVPLIFAHEIAGARLDGSDVSILYYARRLMEGEIVAVPNLELVRPLTSCLRWTLRELLAPQMVSEAQAIVAAICH